MTAPSNANTSELEVVAWRWETPIPHVGDGTKWGWSFASHWSTPPSSINAEPLVTAASAQARISGLQREVAVAVAAADHMADRAAAAEARADRLAKALEAARGTLDAIDCPLTTDRTVAGAAKHAVKRIDTALQQETQK